MERKFTYTVSTIERDPHSTAAKITARIETSTGSYSSENPFIFRVPVKETPPFGAKLELVVKWEES